MKLNQKIQNSLIFLMSLLFFWPGTQKGFWEDELATLADVIDSGNLVELLWQIKYEVHAPGIYFLAFLFDALGITGEVFLRLPSMIVASLGILGLCKIAQRYMHPLWVFLFAALCASLSAIQWHATEFRPHIYLFAAGTWILYYLHEASFSENADFDHCMKKIFYLFTAGLFFDFGTLYMVPVFIVPFLIFYRKKSLRQNQVSVGINRYLALVVFALLVLALYLFSQNFTTVLWGPIPLQKALVSYLMQGFGLKTHPYMLMAAASAIILAALFTKRIEPRLKVLGAFYVGSLALLLFLDYLGVPFIRPRYTLYLLPIPPLLTLICLYSFKMPKILQSAVFIFTGYLIYENLTHPYYNLGDGPRAIVQQAAELTRKNVDSSLVVIGNCRNLIYYLNLIHVNSHDSYLCLSKDSFSKEWKFKSTDKVYVIVHLAGDFNPIAENLKAKILMNVREDALLEVN